MTSTGPTPSDVPEQPEATVPPTSTVETDAPAPPAPPGRPVAREPRAGTVVWGLVVAVCGIGILALAAGFRIDVQLALIVLLAAAGVALLTGSVLGSVRRRRHEGSQRG